MSRVDSTSSLSRTMNHHLNILPVSFFLKLLLTFAGQIPHTFVMVLLTALVVVSFRVPQILRTPTILTLFLAVVFFFATFVAPTVVTVVDTLAEIALFGCLGVTVRWCCCGQCPTARGGLEDCCDASAAVERSRAPRFTTAVHCDEPWEFAAEDSRRSCARLRSINSVSRDMIQFSRAVTLAL